MIVIVMLIMSFRSSSEIPPFYFDFGYNFSRSRMADFNEFIDLYNANPSKDGGYTFTHGFDNIHWLNGFHFGGGYHDDESALEINFARKYNSVFAFYDPATNPTYYLTGFGIDLKTFELALFQKADLDNDLNLQYGFGFGLVFRKMLYFEDDIGNVDPVNSNFETIKNTFTLSFRPTVLVSYPLYYNSPIDIFARLSYQAMLTGMRLKVVSDIKYGYWDDIEEETKRITCGNLELAIGLRFNLDKISFERRPRVEKPIYQPIVNEVVISGNLKDHDNGKPIDGVVTIYRDGKVVASQVTQNGSYSFKVSTNQSLVIETTAFGYKSNALNISVLSQNIKQDISLEKMPIGQAIKLENIIFEKASAVLLPESYPELDKLVKFMQGSPTVKIEVSGHTSSEGNDSYNLKLSQDRANSIANYLASKGIELSRIVAKGYGETMPVASNETEEGKKLNRRVEFKILSF